jgi:predicted nucleic-acid-binding protein
MKGLGTNVLVRFLVDAEGDPKQHQQAAAYMQKYCTPDDPCYVSVVTLCELAWVLQRSYDLDREAIANEIEMLLDVHQLTVADREVVRRALADYRAGNADFPDHLIAWLGHVESCDATATFDRKAGEQALFEYIGNYRN